MRFVAALVSTLMISAPALADYYEGEVKSASRTVKVIDAKGQSAEYAITAALAKAIIDTEYKDLSMSDSGYTAKCGTYLGKLTEDFTVQIRDENGQLITATFPATIDEENSTGVWGECAKGTNVLVELKMQVHGLGKLKLK